MKKKSLLSATGLGLVAALLVCGSASAAVMVSVDENGNGIGTVGGGTLRPDPGPGGLPAVLTYTLPFNTTVGDVALLDEGINIFDVVRFNGNSTLVFYSDNTDGVDSLGDTLSPPGAFYDNRASVTEVGTEAQNGAAYTPLPGQPGFTTGGVTYNLVSDSVPEPASLALFGTGLLGLGLLRRRRT